MNKRGFLVLEMVIIIWAMTVFGYGIHVAVTHNEQPVIECCDDTSANPGK